MAKLKLGTIPDDKPVKLTIELPAAIHRDLVAYGNALGRETGQGVVEPAKLIGPMLARFMATDRAFAKLRRDGVDARKQRTLRNPAQKRRRERASSRMKATNRPTAGSSASGHHTSSTCTQAFSSRIGR